MRCPHCDAEELCKINFKKNKQNAYLCEGCGFYWLEGEHMTQFSGHILTTDSLDEEVGYSYELVDVKDKENQELQDELQRESQDIT